jgi:hypothetical protein
LGSPIATHAITAGAPDGATPGTDPDIDDETGDSSVLEHLAAQIYDHIRRRLLIDRERAGSRPSWFHG